MHCEWFDVRRLKLPVADATSRSAVRLGQLYVSSINRTACAGYMAPPAERAKRPACKRCPGDPFGEDTWHLEQCLSRRGRHLMPPHSSAHPIVHSASASPSDVLLVVSDHNNHGLFAQVERVLNQLHYAASRGFVPYVYLGARVFASHDSCDVGENQYYDARYGDNVWEYYFEQVSTYELGAAEWRGRPVRLLTASVSDVRRHAIATAGDAVTSYFEFKRYDDALHTTRVRVHALAAQLVRRWVRVRPEIRKRAGELLRDWRARSTSLLGVHLRGTDKAVHPKVPLQRYFDMVDAYMKGHPGALIVVATDDEAYFNTFSKRYGERVVSRGKGYATANVVRDPSLSRHGKGVDALIDALLLAHTDYLLKSTSALAEFAIWYNPHLGKAHLDLQIEGAGAASITYRRLIPRWAGGTYDPPEVLPAQASAMVAALLHDGGGGATVASARAQGGAKGGRKRRRRRHGRGRGRAVNDLWAAATADAREAGSDGRVPVWTRQQTLYSLPSIVGGAAATGGLPRPADKPREQKIKVGTCDGVEGLRPMTFDECMQYARREGLNIGETSAEASEPTGCNLWPPSNLEYNKSPKNVNKCDQVGGAGGECVCIRK